MNFGRRTVVIGRQPATPKPGEAEIADAYRGWVFPVEPSRLFATVAPLAADRNGADGRGRYHRWV